MNNHTTETRAASGRYESAECYLSYTENRRQTEQRFMAWVDKDGPTLNPGLGRCWLWKGKPANQAGYGRIRINGQELRSHVVSYLLWRDAIPSGHEIDHLCNNPGCVHPDHLEAVTPAEDKRRAKLRRKAAGIKVRQPSRTDEEEFMRSLSVIASAINGETNHEAAKHAGFTVNSVERHRRELRRNAPAIRAEVDEAGYKNREARKQREQADAYYAERVALHKAHPEIQAQRRQDYLATRSHTRQEDHAKPFDAD